MKNRSCAFFGPDIYDLRRLDAYARWTIENLICDDNITCFVFGSGGSFERVCYEYILESRTWNRHLELKVKQCESVLSLEDMINKS